MGDAEYNLIKDNYIHTIGNLTLSGNNGKLSNKSFLDKQIMNIDAKEQGYKFSRLWFNRDLQEKTVWDKEAIEARAVKMSERFVEIWKIPNIDIEPEANNDEINIFDAEDPKHKKLEYAIFFNQKLEVTQVAKLYTEVFKLLFETQPEAFFTSEIGNKLGLTKTPETSGMRQVIPISDTYFIEGNIDNIGKFDRIKQALILFGHEDELFIKYSD